MLARKVVSGNNTDHNNHLVDRCDIKLAEKSVTKVEPSWGHLEAMLEPS